MNCPRIAIALSTVREGTSIVPSFLCIPTGFRDCHPWARVLLPLHTGHVGAPASQVGPGLRTPAPGACRTPRSQALRVFAGHSINGLQTVVFLLVLNDERHCRSSPEDETLPRCVPIIRKRLGQTPSNFWPTVALAFHIMTHLPTDVKRQRASQEAWIHQLGVHPGECRLCKAATPASPEESWGGPLFRWEETRGTAAVPLWS